MEHTVTIEKIITGGKGLARQDRGKVLMVDGVLPGETVRCSVLKEHPGYSEATLIEIISPSPARQLADCPWYQQCGGCDLQHCAYDLQLEIKKHIINEGLRRTGGIPSGDCLQATLPSPEQTGYRYRLRLKVDVHGRIGFHRKKTNMLVPVAGCPVATDIINRAIGCIQSTSLLKPWAHIFREIELLQSPADDSLTLVLAGNKNQPFDPLKLNKAVEDCPVISQAACRLGGKFTAGPLHPLQQLFTLPDAPSRHYSLSWSPGCFSQINASQNRQLVHLVCTLAGTIRDAAILDLYCGMGNFSIPLALMGATVSGVERNPESIRWAKHNAETSGVTCSFFAVDVRRHLLELSNKQQRVDIIIVDPPRRGLNKTVGLLPKLQPQKIIYVSCDPATLARDIAILAQQGYILQQLTPVDMFPQTHHIESVALLEKN